MNTITTSATASKSPAPQRRIDLEHIYAGLETAATFIAALESFICEAQGFNRAFDAPEIERRNIGNIDTMAFEMKRVIGTARDDLGEFISAAPAANLQIGERA